MFFFDMILTVALFVDREKIVEINIMGSYETSAQTKDG